MILRSQVHTKIMLKKQQQQTTKKNKRTNKQKNHRGYTILESFSPCTPV